MNRSSIKLAIALLAVGAAGAILWIAWTWSNTLSEEVGARTAALAPSSSASSGGELETSLREAIAGRDPLQAEDLAPADEEDHRTDVLVVDPANRPVAGAQVGWLHDDGIKSLGATGLDGRLRLNATSELVEGDAIIASKAGFASRERFLAFPIGKELRIVLAQDASITGTVHAAPGIVEVPGEMTVAAVPISMSMLSRVEDFKSWLDDPRVLVGRSDRDGRFALTGAAVGRKYVVHAGGTGWILASGGVAAKGGDPLIDLVVKPLFGARIHLIGSNGAPFHRIHASGSVADRRIDSRDVSPVEANAFARLLSGVPLDWSKGSDEFIDCLYAAAKPAASVGPLHIHAHYSGYEPKSMDIDLPRFTRVAEDIPLELVPTVDVGSIDLAFEALPPASLGGPGCLRLRSPGEDEGAEMAYAVGELNGTHARLGPIPAGAYEWRFEWFPDVSTRSRQPVSWSKVTVAKDAIVPLVVKNEVACALAIDLVDDQNTRYTGPARFRLGLTDHAPRVPGGAVVPGAIVVAGDDVTFHRAPYRIVGLPPGTLEVHLVGPGFVRGNPNVVPVTLVAGEEQRVSMIIRSEP
jgi:hypothetical protein